MSKCKVCFFSEISLRNGAGIDTTSYKLWCWLHEKHVSKTYGCVGWTDSATQGDPRGTAEHYRDNKMVRRYQKWKKKVKI